MQEVRGRGHEGGAEKHRGWGDGGGGAGKLENAGEVNWRLKLGDMIQRDH